MGNASAAARILYVVELDPSRKFGSLEQCIVTLAARSRARGGLLVPVFCGPVPSSLSRRLDIVNAPFVASFDLETWSWSAARRLLALVDEYAVDVVDFSFYGPLNHYVTLLRVMRSRLRLVYTDHHSRLPKAKLSSWWRRTWRKIALLQYSRILAISDFTYATLGKEGWPRLARCQLFVDPVRFRADPTVRDRVRKELGADGDFVALVVAHLITWKGVDVALRAIALASPSAKVWIVGTGPELDNLQRLARDLNLGSRVSFLGEQQDVSPYMQGADCLICPSLWQEAMGFVNLEAMASGLPVVASRTGGIPELVINEATGLLVEPGDADQTAAALSRLIKSPDLRKEMGRKGAAHVGANFSEEACLERYLKNYEDLIGNHAG
jgi:L-malate glycosyltransferase